MVMIKEFTNDELGYDVVEDAMIYMRNNPMFYRKYYFPAMTKACDCCRENKKLDMSKIVMPMIERGINAYVKQYKIARHPEEVFRPEERQALFDRICNEEMPRIEAGEY